MSGLDDAMAGLRAVAGASDRTMRAAGAGPVGKPSAPRSLTANALALRDHARALWGHGRLDTVDIARELGVHEAVVCGMLVRPGEFRTESRGTRS